MSLTALRSGRRSGTDFFEEQFEGPGSAKNVLCVAFDARGAREAVPVSADHALELGGRLLVIAAYTSAYSCAGPMAACWGLPAIDPTVVASSEIAEIVGDHATSVSTVWFPDWRRAPAAAAAVLGEGSYGAAYVAPAPGRRGTREARRVLTEAARHCTAIELGRT